MKYVFDFVMPRIYIIFCVQQAIIYLVRLKEKLPQTFYADWVNGK